MKLFFVFALAGLLALLAGATEPGPTLGPEAAESFPPDDDPTIYPEEVVYPAAEAEDGWGARGSPDTWHEDPESVDCQAVPEWCQESQNQTVEA